MSSPVETMHVAVKFKVDAWGRREDMICSQARQVYSTLTSSGRRRSLVRRIRKIYIVALRFLSLRKLIKL